jgi:hypothetical protein
VLFAGAIAPLEYHFQWAHLWFQTPTLGAFLAPLPSGLLYFYALILAIEALLVRFTSPDIAEVSGMWVVELMLYVPIAMFIFGYIVSGHYPTPWNHHAAIIAPSPDELTVQWITAVWALAGSLVIHAAAIKFEARRLLET